MIDPRLAQRFVIPDAEMPQGKKAWREWRKSIHLTATRANEVLRLWKPEQWGGPQSWDEARAPREYGPPNEAMRHGTRCEPIARALLNSKSWTGDLEFEPACVEAQLGDHVLGASLDGWARDGDVEYWLEIKSPFKATASDLWRDAVDHERVDPIYLPQLAMQAFLMPDTAVCYWAVYIPEMFDRYSGEQTERERLRVLTVGRDILQPYIDQLAHLAPLFLSGADEPTFEDYPLVGVPENTDA